MTREKKGKNRPGKQIGHVSCLVLTHSLPVTRTVTSFTQDAANLSSFCLGDISRAHHDRELTSGSSTNQLPAFDVFALHGLDCVHVIFVTQAQLADGAEASGEANAFLGDEDGVVCSASHRFHKADSGNLCRAQADTRLVVLIMSDQGVILELLLGEFNAELAAV